MPRRVGRKIGLTSPAVQQMFGVDPPDFGVLFADMAIGDGEPIPRDALLQPRVEAEVAFVLGTTSPTVRSSPATCSGPPTSSSPRSRSSTAGSGLEHLDRRHRRRQRFVWHVRARRIAEAAARHRRLRACEMSITVDGGDVVSSGIGAACLGSPINAVVWLANAVAERGAPLRAGEVILSGSLGPLVTVERGSTYEATISGLGSVRATFEA